MPGNIRFLVGVIYKRCISFVTVHGTAPIILNVSLFSIRLFLAHVYETLGLYLKQNKSQFFDEGKTEHL